MAQRIVILSGARGAGKSTICHRAVALARAKGYTCAGLITVRGPHDALDVLDVRTGALRRLTVEAGARPAVIQGRFRFAPQTLAWGNAALSQAIPCQLLVIDELGPLELERGQGWTQALHVLAQGGFDLALVVVRPELVACFRTRLPGIETQTLNATPENRNQLPTRVVERLGACLSAQAPAA